jgi:hypothetical protein
MKCACGCDKEYCSTDPRKLYYNEEHARNDYQKRKREKLLEENRLKLEPIPCACGCGKFGYSKTGKPLKWFSDNHRSAYNVAQRRKTEKDKNITLVPEPRKCARVGCDCLFIPKRPKSRQMYCSDSCSVAVRKPYQEEYARMKREKRKQQKKVREIFALPPKKCARKECNNSFIPKRPKSLQMYCSTYCSTFEYQKEYCRLLREKRKQAREQKGKKYERKIM